MLLAALATIGSLRAQLCILCYVVVAVAMLLSVPEPTLVFIKSFVTGSFVWHYVGVPKTILDCESDENVNWLQGYSYI